MTWKIYGSAWKRIRRSTMTKTRHVAMHAAFMSLIVSFKREDFLLLEWKEA